MSWFRRNRKFAAELRNIALCGHVAPADGKGMVFEDDVTLSRNEDGRFFSCFTCIEESSIRCAWCGGAIAYGDGITLYYPHGLEGQEPREDAVRYDDAYIGCLYSSCSDGFDMGGNWVEDEQSPGQGRVMHISEGLAREA